MFIPTVHSAICGCSAFPFYFYATTNRKSFAETSASRYFSDSGWLQ
jgi:hypothetical protein